VVPVRLAVRFRAALVRLLVTVVSVWNCPVAKAGFVVGLELVAVATEFVGVLPQGKTPETVGVTVPVEVLVVLRV
jgi:hypothetical protein